MKHLQLLSSIAFLALSLTNAFSQNNGKTNFDFFAKKNSSYTLQETGYYGRMNVFDNGQKTGHTNGTWVDVDMNHWFGGGLGAGLDVYANWSGSHYTSDQLTRYWTISPSLSYGKTVNDRWGIYGRAGVTFGLDRYIYDLGTVHSDEKSNLFGYNGTLAFPYRLSKYTALTTQIQYNHLTTDFDGGKDKDNTFGLNLHLEDYLGCGDMRCDPHTGFKLSQHKYDRGSGLINYTTRAHISFGNSETEYDAGLNPSKNDFTDADINFNGMYYVMHYVALGGGLRFGHSVEKSGNGSNKYTYNYFDFNPELNVNVPVDNGWRNLFFKGGGYFGFDKNVSTSGTLTFTNKTSISGFNIGIGFNAMFAEQTALRTCIYYGSVTNKDKETHDKTKQEGISVSVGLTHLF